MNATATTSLLLKSGGAGAAEAIERGLRAAGVRVVCIPTAYDAVAEMDRARGMVRHLILGVDHFGPGEFRLLPLVRREWPEAILVAYHAPGFEYKGRLAELVGADIILSGPDAVAFFIDSQVAVAAAPMEGVEPEPPPPPVRRPAPAAAVRPMPAPVVMPRVLPVQEETPASAPSDQPKPPTAAEAIIQRAGQPDDVRGPMPGDPRAERQPAHVAPPDLEHGAAAGEPDPFDDLVDDGELASAEVIGTIELTDEELRILLGEDEA